MSKKREVLEITRGEFLELWLGLKPELSEDERLPSAGKAESASFAAKPAPADQPSTLKGVLRQRSNPLRGGI